MIEQYDQTWFKDQSLRLLTQQVSEQTYPNYPEQADRLYGKLTNFHVIQALGNTAGKAFATPTKQLALPTETTGTRDALNRPLHPWAADILAGPGAVLGSGFYWFWGENKAADGIPVRYDLHEPHILIGNRADTGQPAFLGGMVEDKTDLETAYSEIEEEAFLDIRSMPHEIEEVYQGPLADVRATLHAWPTTTAYLLHLTDDVDTPMRWNGKSDEMPDVYWHPVSKLDHLAGSHRLIAQIALASLRA